MNWVYVLTDMAGVHYWTDGLFRRADLPCSHAEVTCFATEARARQQTRAERQRGVSLKVVRAALGPGGVLCCRTGRGHRRPRGAAANQTKTAPA